MLPLISGAIDRVDAESSGRLCICHANIDNIIFTSIAAIGGRGGAYLLGYITVIGENSDDASSPKQAETSASLRLSLSGGGE